MKIAVGDNVVYNVKVELNGELRRFSHEGLVFQSLRDKVVELFGIDKDAPLVLRYVDDESDRITMSSNAELKEAVLLSQSVLRLQASIKTDAPAPEPEPVKTLNDAPNLNEAKKEFEDAKLQWHARRHQWKEWKQKKQSMTEEERKQLKAQRMAWREQRKEHGGRGHGCHKEGKEGKLAARHVKDVTIEDGTEVPSAVPFVKTWRIRNEGAAWPAGCRLLFISHKGDNFGSPEFIPVPVEGEVQPGQEVDISVPLVAPVAPGRYTGFWRMCTPEGRKFGQRVWVSITVPTQSSSSSDEKGGSPSKYDALADAIAEMGFAAKKKLVLRLLNKTDGDVEKVVSILTKRGKGLKLEQPPVNAAQ